MASGFSKEETVLFGEMLKGFNDALALTPLVRKYTPDMTMLARNNNEFWRPMPQSVRSFDGVDMTNNYSSVEQLSVPSRVGINKCVPIEMTEEELRDAMREGDVGKAAMVTLSSNINTALLDAVSARGSIIVKRTTSATGFDDVAKVKTALKRVGVPLNDVNLCLSSQDYDGMASNLQGRQTINEIPTKALRDGEVGRLAQINTFELDYSNSLTACTAVATVNGANQYYTPKSTIIDIDGNTVNVDNRYGTINLTVSSGTFKVGDCISFTGVNETHHVQLGRDTGSLKTFRIVGIPNGGGTGTYTITPPIISAQGGTDAEYAYQNVTATPANGASVIVLNTVTAPINPFWYKDSVEFYPSQLAVKQQNSVDVMKSTTDQGITVTQTRSFDQDKFVYKYRWDIFFGVNVLNTEMGGIILFGQS